MEHKPTCFYSIDTVYCIFVDLEPVEELCFPKRSFTLKTSVYMYRQSGRFSFLERQTEQRRALRVFKL